MKRSITLIQPIHLMPLEPGQLSLPTGLGYISAYLRSKGHEVKIIDMYAGQFSRSRIEEEIRKIDTDAVGIGAFSTQYAMVKWLAELIKKNHPGMQIIAGGPIATLGYRLLLEKTMVDVCVIGEGEFTAAELLEMPAGADLSGVPGLAIRDGGGGVLLTAERPYIKNLDELPPPDYSLFNMDRYLHTLFMQTTRADVNARVYGIKTIAMITGRGCPYSCRFCSKSFTGVRFRSVDSVVEEIKYFKEKYGVRGVHFMDELAVVNKKRVKELTEKIKPLNIVFDCQARVNVVDREMLGMLKDAGCIVVGFGVESGSQKILDAMNKRQTVEQIERAIADCNDLGLEIKIQLIFGYPGEDEGTVNETVEMFRRMKHPGRRFNILAPLPGTPIYDMAVASGMIAGEEEYLTSLSCDFGGSRIKANFTSFSDDEYLSRKIAAEQQMKENFIEELKKNPEEWAAYRKSMRKDNLMRQRRRIINSIKDPSYFATRLKNRLFVNKSETSPSSVCSVCGNRDLCAVLGVKKY